MKKIVIFLVTLLSVMATGCVQPDKPVDPDINIDVPEGSFDFSTIRNISLKVYIYDQHQGQFYYTVEVLDGNPFTGSDAKVIDAGVTKGDAPYTSTISLAKITSNLYIRQTDPSKRQSVKILNIEDGTSFTCDFRPVTSSSAPASSAIAASNDNLSAAVESSNAATKAVDREYASSYKLPSTYRTLTSGNSDKNLGAGTYYVPEDLSLTLLSSWGKKDIYIAGTLNLGAAVSNCFAPGSVIVVLDGGKLNLTDDYVIGQANGNNIVTIAIHDGGTLTAERDFNLEHSAKLINDGTVEVKGNFKIVSNNAIVFNNKNLTAKHLEMSNKSSLYNYAQVNLTTGRITTNNPYIYNANSFVVSQTFYSTNSGATIENDKYIQINKLDAYNSGITIINNCMMKMAEFRLQGGYITCNPGSLTACEMFEASLNKNIELYGDAMFTITDLPLFSTSEVGMYCHQNRSEFTGHIQGGKTPVLIIDVITNPSDKNVLSLLGNLQVVCNGVFGSNYIHKMSSGVTMTNTLIINTPLGSCNDTHVEDPEDPEDPDFPIDIVDPTVYTFAMEDRWPEFGDYDMNDIVYDISNITRSQDQNNDVLAFKFDISPRCAGGVISMCVMLQMDMVPTEYIKDISSTVYATSFESDQTRANIVLIQNYHRDAFGRSTVITNTEPGAPHIQAPSSTYTINFNTPIDKDKLIVSALNYYIYLGADGNDRREIHIGGFAPSDKVHQSTNGYIGANGMVWGFMIPDARFLYPIEKTSIEEAYRKFANWAKTYGFADSDWYLLPTDGKIYSR
ncbi:MAG: LruC domain-containing protein [Bacteroidales bacterium]|nr:LruC domain-containing protein [Bacteroidales bacterium]MDD4669566.1 LruC domain-containing protein [Bacteroidales bacterium]